MSPEPESKEDELSPAKAAQRDVILNKIADIFRDLSGLDDDIGKAASYLDTYDDDGEYHRGIIIKLQDAGLSVQNAIGSLYAIIGDRDLGFAKYRISWNEGESEAFVWIPRNENPHDNIGSIISALDMVSMDSDGENDAGVQIEEVK